MSKVTAHDKPPFSPQTMLKKGGGVGANKGYIDKIQN